MHFDRGKTGLHMQLRLESIQIQKRRRCSRKESDGTRFFFFLSQLRRRHPRFYPEASTTLERTPGPAFSTAAGTLSTRSPKTKTVYTGSTPSLNAEVKTDYFFSNSPFEPNVKPNNAIFCSPFCIDIGLKIGPFSFFILFMTNLNPISLLNCVFVDLF